MLNQIDIDDVIAIARKAGEEIMKIYTQEFDVTFKEDQSPLTLADQIAHQVITEGLQKYQLPILSEEGRNIPFEERASWEYFWMVDPLDGTKEFIKKNGEFTVNIALIHKNTPTLGVVYAPAIDTLYYTDHTSAYKVEHGQTTKLPISRNDDKLLIVASKSHLNEETKSFIDAIETDKEKLFLSKGSSLKLCMVAEGSADLYPRLAPTMEWDTAAADAIVRKSGKKTYCYQKEIEYSKLLSLNGCNQTLTLLQYNKRDLLNPWFIVV
ncbi:MAG: 3'(2'),5'-bisphosphate nucleotidase [Hydrogenimonas sp.]|nr:MAG: 3'(2'),5'-bisphosphate nucleotidase [Hydrogenimonas sp.]